MEMGLLMANHETCLSGIAAARGEESTGSGQTRTRIKAGQEPETKTETEGQEKKNQWASEGNVRVPFGIYPGDQSSMALRCSQEGEFCGSVGWVHQASRWGLQNCPTNL